MKNFLCFSIFIFCFSITHAQLLDNLKGKFKQSATNNATDFNSSRSNKEKNLIKNNEKEAQGGSIGSQNDDLIEEPSDSSSQKAVELSIDDRYDYTVLSSYTTRNSSEETPVETIFYVGENGFLLYSESNMMINDPSRQLLIMADSINKLVYVTANQTENEIDYAVLSDLLTETGNIKIIFGFEAREFEVLGTQNKLWISQTTELNPSELISFRQLEKMIFGIPYSQLSGLNGILLSVQVMDENQQLVSEFSLSKLIKKNKQIDLTGYQTIGN